jgi:hypothetical protein
MLGTLPKASISDSEHSFSQDEEQTLKAMRGGLAKI